jgi:O-acetylserine/cysteine efflux transporter
MPPGLAALVLQAQVVLTVLIAAGALRERPSVGQVAGVLVGGGGLVIVGLGRGGHVPATALLLCLAAALSWAIGNVVSRAARLTGGGLSLTVWSALVVPAPLLALSVLLDGPGAVRDGLRAFGWDAALSTLYTAGLASLVGYGVFNTLLSRNPSSAVVPWVLVAPVVAAASAWPLRGEVPNTAELTGGALLLLGVLVAQGLLKRGRPPRRDRRSLRSLSSQHRVHRVGDIGARLFGRRVAVLEAAGHVEAREPMDHASQQADGVDLGVPGDVVVPQYCPKERSVATAGGNGDRDAIVGG